MLGEAIPKLTPPSFDASCGNAGFAQDDYGLACRVEAFPSDCVTSVNHLIISSFFTETNFCPFSPCATIR